MSALRGDIMERIINIHIEKLLEGFCLATSDDIQGLVAQGRTVTETMEIARDVARRLLEAQGAHKKSLKLPLVKKSFDLQLVVAN
jgi:predicted RNase H-like HicB family nuclease